MFKNMVNTLKRKNRLTRMLAMVAMVMAWLFACGMGQRGSALPPELSVGVLLAGTQGIDNHQEASAEWIASREELEQLLAGQKARQLPAQDQSAAFDIDFNVSRILIVHMGQKPTAGYSLKLDPDSCSISQETAYISLVLIEPAPGMVAAQVITNPYILLKLSKGDYDAVKVVDQNDQILFNLPVED
jgi:hypothetical protein